MPTFRNTLTKWHPSHTMVIQIWHRHPNMAFCENTYQPGGECGIPGPGHAQVDMHRRATHPGGHTLKHILPRAFTHRRAPTIPDPRRVEVGVAEQARGLEGGEEGRGLQALECGIGAPRIHMPRLKQRVTQRLTPTAGGGRQAKHPPAEDQRSHLSLQIRKQSQY